MKLSWKRVLLDPSLWVLIGVNIYLLFRYEQQPRLFTTVIWLYWTQSVLLGCFAYLTVLISPVPVVSGTTKHSFTAIKDRMVSRKVMWSFLIIYIVLHLFYSLFLISMPMFGHFDTELFKNFLIVFLLSQLFSFIQQAIYNKRHPDKIRVSPIPLLRILPMHICIVLARSNNVTNILLFLSLKLVIDLITHLFTTNFYRLDDPKSTTATYNITNTFSDT